MNGSKNYFSKANKIITPCHYTSGAPKTQMELVFSEHWNFLQEFLPKKAGRSLEVGCGRANLSLYFAKNGWHTALLDQSQDAIDAAKQNYICAGKRVTHFSVCDAEEILYDRESFDCVFSVGLLEHFVDPSKVIKEHYRVCKTGGVIAYYIVPEKPSIQSLFAPLNKILSLFSKTEKETNTLYRATDNMTYYKDLIESVTQDDAYAVPVFPIPLISHSVAFPFIALPKPLERVIVLLDRAYLWIRGLVSRRRWACSELTAQGFWIIQFKGG